MSGGAPTLLRGRLVGPDRVLADGVVEIHDGRITRVADASTYPPTRLPQPLGTLLPGLVDLHCHGGGGTSFTTGEASATQASARHHHEHGTTSVVASTVTDAADRLLIAVAAAAAAAGRGEVAAIHLEGPFLAPRRCGAQDPRHLRRPDLGLARELLEAGEGHIRVMTVAPELPGSDVLIELLADHDVVAAVGHTEADTATALRALRASAGGLVTHLFNGMPPLHHREPGPVAAALTAAAHGQARVELIADGVHLTDEVVRMVFALLGPDRVAVVTDAMAAAGMPDGDYTLGPQRVTVSGGVARLADGRGSIAGGTARLIEVVRRCVQRAGVPLVDAVRAASVTPATVLGLEGEVGALLPGLRADVCVVDDDLRPVRVMRGGSWLG